MLGKLAYRNTKRNIKDYLIYLITVTASFSLIFAFNLVATHLVVIENILLGILAFALAIPIGFLFSQFVSLVIVNLLGIPKTLFISLNFVSIVLLIIYFLTIYVLVLLNLLRRISKMTIRDFLQIPAHLTTHSAKS